MKKIILIFLLVIMLFSVSVSSDKSTDQTGLHLLMANTYNLNLIDWETSSKYKEYDDKFIILDVHVQDQYFNDKYLTWIMKYDKYQDLKEKV